MSSANTREHARIEPKGDAANKDMLLWHATSPVVLNLPGAMVRRMPIGLAMGAIVIPTVGSPSGNQSGADFNPPVAYRFYRLTRVALWGAVFCCAAQFLGIFRHSGPAPACYA